MIFSRCRYVNLEFDGIKNPLLAEIPILYLWKHQKFFSFLKFSGSMKNKYWSETGLVSWHKCCAEGNKTIPISLPKHFLLTNKIHEQNLKKDSIVWPPTYKGLSFVKIIERVGSRFSYENGRLWEDKHFFSLMMYGYCGNNALHSLSLSFAMSIFLLNLF